MDAVNPSGRKPFAATVGTKTFPVPGFVSNAAGPSSLHKRRPHNHFLNTYHSSSLLSRVPLPEADIR
jgi:hypothetical protein